MQLFTIVKSCPVTLVLVEVTGPLPASLLCLLSILKK
ncbi:hypothetical protein BVRB_6g155030 [Beta vulgaris subsp. vulgaris]|nr:hypothetical protein BVRB_6g155030 [Beta vulgaris subsp. vulgaris]